jgi:uncharacterized membrane protein YkoI
MKKLPGYLLKLLVMTPALLLASFLVPLLLAPQLAIADDDWRKLHKEVQAGRIKPLSDILDGLAKDWVGQVVDVDYEQKRGRQIYEVELLGPEGQVVEFEIDAATGELIGIEGSNINAMKREK